MTGEAVRRCKPLRHVPFSAYTCVKLIISFISDRLVMIGNHRDAWGKGAVDAASSTAVMLEISRVMGRMLKKGKAYC